MFHPSIGRIIHVRAMVAPTTVNCIAAIVTTEVDEYRMGSLPSFMGFEFTLFAPHGSTLDAARRGAPLPVDSADWHDPRDCDKPGE